MQTQITRTIRKGLYFTLISMLCAFITSCGGGGQDPDPFVEDFGIAFVKRPLGFDDEGLLIQPDIREALTFNPGGDLMFRELASPTAPQRNVTAGFTGGLGDVKDVEVSYDGEKLLFAMRAPEIEDADPEDQPTWNIWEYEIATSLLRRIISSNITAEDGQDVAPHYLPDGRIMFSSTRQRLSKAILLDEGKPQFPALDENRNERALVLHIMNDDGTDIRQVSTNQSHDLDAMVLSSGEVVFSRWDHMGSRDAISLYKMNPDGTEHQLLYGAHSHANGTSDSDVHFLQPRELPDGRLLAVVLPFTDSNRSGRLMEIDINNYIDNTMPTAPNQGVLTGPAQVPATINNVYTDDTVSPGGRFSSAWPLDDGTNRMLVSWSECRLLELGNIVPCTPDRLLNPAAIEANPIYGIFIYDRNKDSQLPIVVPVEGVVYTDVIATTPRTLPNIIPDQLAGAELDMGFAGEGVGILNIRSVYDVDGVDTASPDIPTLADPAVTLADQRPARFLRIVKAVSIPDEETLDLPDTAFGASSEQQMREIIGYVPIQPDGSVRVKVPANVPLAISVVDREGRRRGGRHQNWLRVSAGETVTCNGCHDHGNGVPHGHPESPLSVYPGSLLDGPPFPNTDPLLTTEFGETMAETLARHDPAALSPAVDIIYTDDWSVPPVNTEFDLSYSDLATLAPASLACQTSWDNTCRTVIHYEQHIHPLWSQDRGADTCINCHTPVDAAMMPKVPDAQLDLTDGLSPDENDHFKAYRELLVEDFAQNIGPMGLQDILVPAIDPLTGLPIMVQIPVGPPMSTAGAMASTAFTSRFNPGGTHEGRLQPYELRLVHEWLDVGGQYYNDPFAVPVP